MKYFLYLLLAFEVVSGKEGPCSCGSDLSYNASRIAPEVDKISQGVWNHIRNTFTSMEELLKSGLNLDVTKLTGAVLRTYPEQRCVKGSAKNAVIMNGNEMYEVKKVTIIGQALSQGVAVSLCECEARRGSGEVCKVYLPNMMETEMNDVICRYKANDWMINH